MSFTLEARINAWKWDCAREHVVLMDVSIEPPNECPACDGRYPAASANPDVTQ